MNRQHSEDPFLGPAAPDLGWVPAPRYLMRRARLRPLLAALSPGTLLEIGPGAGALLIEAGRRGFQCEALESSREAREIAAAMIADHGLAIPVHASPGDWAARFDTLCAFEVLEHIEHDREALRQWREWLRPGGVLLLSVPAKMRLWTARDEWAGHFRRYERQPLLQLMRDAGYAVEHFECYGFPLANLSERLSASSYERLMRGTGGATDRRSQTDRSGVDRGPQFKIYPLVKSTPGKLSLRLFSAVQAAFIHTDLGSGYLLKARRT